MVRWSARRCWAVRSCWVRRIGEWFIWIAASDIEGRDQTRDGQMDKQKFFCTIKTSTAAWYRGVCCRVSRLTPKLRNKVTIKSFGLAYEMQSQIDVTRKLNWWRISARNLRELIADSLRTLNLSNDEIWANFLGTLSRCSKGFSTGTCRNIFKLSWAGVDDSTAARLPPSHIQIKLEENRKPFNLLLSSVHNLEVELSDFSPPRSLFRSFFSVQQLENETIARSVGIICSE